MPSRLKLDAERKKLESSVERMATAQARYQREDRAAFELAEEARRTRKRIRPSPKALRSAMMELASAEAAYITQLERVRELEQSTAR